MTSSVANLTVERRESPLGIDTNQPRFAWQLSEGRQTAYQLEVTDVAGDVLGDTAPRANRAGWSVGSRGPEPFRSRDQ